MAAFDVVVMTYALSGTVTLNGASLLSNTTSCSVVGDYTYYPRGTVVFTERTKGYVFSADLQGCTNTTATFSMDVLAGIYEVTVLGTNSDLPQAADLTVSMQAVP